MSESSDKPISRKPPEAVKLLLRQEVGFGCPLPYCRLPFLSFHHFDPPWHKEHHHRPEGMIALCVQHHEMADRGALDKARLHASRNRITPSAMLKRNSSGQEASNKAWRGQTEFHLAGSDRVSS